MHGEEEQRGLWVRCDVSVDFFFDVRAHAGQLTLRYARSKVGVTTGAPISFGVAGFHFRQYDWWQDQHDTIELYDQIQWGEATYFVEGLSPGPYAEADNSPPPSSRSVPSRSRYRDRELRAPLWFFLVILATYPAIAFIRGPLRRYRRRKRGLCIRCGYNLTGLTEPRCPECGHGI